MAFNKIYQPLFHRYFVWWFEKKNETKTALTRVIINLVSFLMNDARSLALCGLKNKTKQNEPDLFWATSRFTTKYLNCSLSISKRDSLSGPHPHQFSGDRTSDIKSDCWSRVRLRVVKLWISRPRSPLNLQNHERILYYKTNREALG